MSIRHAQAPRQLQLLLLFCLLVSPLVLVPAETEAQSPCSNGVVVPSPQSNSSRNLVTECNALLALKDTLRGQAPLDWSPSKPIALWEGITLSDSRYAVTSIDLSRKGLDGTLPPGLGRLSRLERLVLHNNALRGPIPPSTGRPGPSQRPGPELQPAHRKYPQPIGRFAQPPATLPCRQFPHWRDTQNSCQPNGPPRHGPVQQQPDRSNSAPIPTSRQITHSRCTGKQWSQRPPTVGFP